MKNAIEKAQLVQRLLVRAPALSARYAFDGERAAELPSVRSALTLAAPEQASARTIGRYVRRMAFRTTPSGLLGGATVGELGEKSAVRSGGPGRAHLGVGLPRIFAAARALLDDEAVREQVRLRQTPSLLTDGERAAWLSREAEVERAPVDELLGAVLAATGEWTPWPAVRDALRPLTDDDGAIDDLLLQLVDGGLLHHDLAPPLVGPPSLPWLRARLARLAPVPRVIEIVDALLDAIGQPVAADDPDLPARIARIEALAASLPGEPTARSVTAILELLPSRMVLGRAAVARAAALAPILFRLDHALSGTPFERARSPLLDETARTLVELHEPGDYPLAALELGEHGPSLAEARPPLASDLPSLPPESRDDRFSLPASLLRLLVEKIARARENVVALTSDELNAVLPSVETPDSFELVLAPCREPRRAPPGTDWQLGLHGPAGATWGRFAGALGAPLARAFAELFAVEKRVFGDALLADVAYAPDAVADVAAHPALRAATLALSSWPDGGETIRPADLALRLGPELGAGSVAESPSALALTDANGRAIRPSQLSRIRSTTVGEEGAHRLLVGWSLQRAVAPWALHLGPLELARTPRFTVDGFVVAPASWAIPRALVGACRGKTGRAAIAKWRAAEGVPARVQIGFEDQLLPLALDDADAAGELASLVGDGPAPRVYEIWPPLDRLLDGDGRRIEAIVAVLAERPARAATANRVATRAADGWRTFKLFGAPDRADHVLAAAVLPAVDGARAAREIDRWFFLRYLDGARHHLRVRVRGDGDRFAARLGPLLADHAVTVETAGYFPEHGRYGGAPATEIVEQAFESDSVLAGALATLDADLRPPGGDLLARAYDALTRGIGLSLDERRAIAADCRTRTAHLVRPDPDAPDPLAPFYRQRQAPLTAALASDGNAREIDAASAHLIAHTRRLAGLPRAPLLAVLPSLLHLSAVRLVGPGAAREAIGYYLWQRALDSLARRR